MNIFALSTEEAVKEIQKVLDSIPREKMIEELKACGLEVREVKRMKLIDAVNMIAKGELERGTVIEWGEFTYTYINIGFVRENDNAGFVSIWCDINEENLNDEVEIIGKDTNVAAKIEEIEQKLNECQKALAEKNLMLNIS